MSKKQNTHQNLTFERPIFLGSPSYVDLIREPHPLPFPLVACKLSHGRDYAKLSGGIDALKLHSSVEETVSQPLWKSTSRKTLTEREAERDTTI